MPLGTIFLQSRLGIFTAPCLPFIRLSIMARMRCHTCATPACAVWFDISICLIENMTVLTVCLLGMHCCWPSTPKIIYALCYLLKMPWVYTCRITTEVVNSKISVESPHAQSYKKSDAHINLQPRLC